MRGKGEHTFGACLPTRPPSWRRAAASNPGGGCSTSQRADGLRGRPVGSERSAAEGLPGRDGSWRQRRYCATSTKPRRRQRLSPPRTWRCSRCRTSTTRTAHPARPGRGVGHWAAAWQDCWRCGSCTASTPRCARAWQAGVVLTGVSAGSICWHVGGTTDSFGPELRPVTDGLALAALLQRRALRLEAAAAPAAQRLIADGTCPRLRDRDGAGLYRGADFVEAVSERDGAAAYFVMHDGDAAVEVAGNAAGLGAALGELGQVLQRVVEVLGVERRELMCSRIRGRNRDQS